MKITYEGGRFIARFQGKTPLSLKGFIRRTAVNGFIAVDDGAVLRHLDACDETARTEALARAQAAEDRIADSYALDADIDIPKPPGLKYEYRGYQKAGIAYALSRKATLIGDAMRLGKTVQAIGVMSCTPDLKKVLVICPASVKTQWAAMIKTWCVHQDLTIGIVSGQDRSSYADITIINYDILVNHLDEIYSREWDVLICDESHYLRNPDASRTKCVLGPKGKKGQIEYQKKFKPIRAKRMLFLSGTQYYKRPVDLWPIVRVCDPDGLGKDWYHFVRRYCDAKKGPFGIDTSGASNLEELQRIMRERFMIRREKHQVAAELPPQRMNVVLPKKGLERLINAENDAASSVAAMRDRLGEFLTPEYLEGFMERFGISAEEDDVLSQIEQGNNLATIRKELAMAKLPMVASWLEDFAQSVPKAIVFGYHREFVQALHAKFPGSVMIIGATSTKARDEAKRRFIEDEDCQFIFGNIVAMGQGIDLSVADDVVFTELSWIASEMDQAEERAWSVVKTKPVSIWRLLVEDSLDFRMSGVLEKNQRDIARAMNIGQLKQ